MPESTPAEAATSLVIAKRRDAPDTRNDEFVSNCAIMRLQRFDWGGAA